MNVAVTAAGGGVGQSIIKALSDTKYKVVAIDPDPLAAGLYLNKNKSYINENCNSKNYINNLISICKKGKCSFLFSGFDAELPILSDNFEKLRSADITPFISDPAVIEIADNKYKLYEFLKNNGFPYIKTARNIQEADEIGISPPIIVKPMVGGCRSKDVMYFKTFKEVDSFIAGRENDFIIQEYIEGDEYTCGSVTFNKDVRGIIVMRRILRDGDTYKAFVDMNKSVVDFVGNILSEINPFGPCNIQLRLKDNIPYILEINARCSGTTAARALAGFNEPEMCCNFITGKPVVHNIKKVTILRYWNELIIDPKVIEEVKNEGYINRCKRFIGK